MRVVGRNCRPVEMVVVGVSRTPSNVPALRRGVAASGFGVKAERAGRPDAAVPMSGVSMVSLLAMQEAESEAQQDREARQHGEAVVDELTGLQLALLGHGEGNTARLIRLVERPVVASDPMLAGLLRAVRVRAAVELARRERAAAA